jgi:hypothetical protein
MKCGFRPRAWRVGGCVLAALCIVLGAQRLTAQSQAPDPQRNIQVMFVKNVLTAVNHANLTGNYTVLRDLGGAAFREKNTAAQLATTFQRIRDLKTDLSPILVLDPQFTQAPAQDSSGRLLLFGTFPTRPLEVRFQLVFERINGAWVIDAVAVGLAESKQSDSSLGSNTSPSPAQSPRQTNSVLPSKGD